MAPITSSRDVMEEPQSPPGRRQMGMATALSIDQLHPTPESKCQYPPNPSLSVNFVSMLPSKSSTATTSSDNGESAKTDGRNRIPIAARAQEIFMDLIGMKCANLEASSPRHVLDERFDSFLDTGEREFKDSLMEFLASQTDRSKQTHSYQFLESFLQSEMGFRNTYYWSNRQYKRQPSSADENENDDDDDDRDESLASMSEHETANHQNMDTSESDPGHVFVCKASVCAIQCDAFLCSGSIRFEKEFAVGRIHKRWKEQTLSESPILNQQINNPYRFKPAYDPLSSDDDDDDNDDYNAHHNVDTDRWDHHPRVHRAFILDDWPWDNVRDYQIPYVVFGEVSIEKSYEFASMPKRSLKKGDLPEEQIHIEALMETARQFLTGAMKQLKQNQPKPYCNRQRYLLALPVLGTGGGFAGDLTGQVVERLLSIIDDFVRHRSDVDVVLVCADEATYTHAQVVRRKEYEKHRNQNNATDYSVGRFPCFQHFDSERIESASQLAQLAVDRHLALFLGAGTSIGSGLPSWFGLLHIIEDLFTETGAPSERSLGTETDWDPVVMADRLEVICQSKTDRYGIQQSLKHRVCTYLSERGTRPGLLLSLLMSLPCDSFVTQNYDQLIETAFDNENLADKWQSRSNNHTTNSTKPLSILPFKPEQNTSKWLLKMHGCVSTPEDIVLTGNDYSSYHSSSSSRPLAGLVQASLMTKHLLFVGFSLTDPNYLSILDQVRDALQPYSKEEEEKDDDDGDNDEEQSS